MTALLIAGAVLTVLALLPYEKALKAVEGSVAYQGLYKGRLGDDVKGLFPPKAAEGTAASEARLDKVVAHDNGQ